MLTNAPTRKFSLTCQQCGVTGVPVRVESQTPSTIALAIRCDACGHDWRAEGDLPAFLAWVKPDRRRAVRDAGPSPTGA